MSYSTANPYQKALIGAAAVAFLYILLLAFAATRRVENEFEAGNWGYVLGLFVFTTLIGTLAAGYWTQKSSKDLSFARVALSLACAYSSTLSADRRFDEMLKGTADGFFAKFKAQGIELVSGATGDGAIGPYAGRRLEFDNKGGAVSLHGEIVTADAPACRLLMIAYHAGEPYDAMKGVIDRFKASVK